MNFSRQLILISVFLSVFSSAVLALGTTHSIQIKADHAELDEKSGITTYSGDVELDQGQLSIKADKVVIKTSNHQVTEVIATGKPASYIDKDNGNPLLAKSRTIRYQLSEDIIQLIDDASLEQGGSTITGDHIDYDLKSRKVKARGDTSNGSKNTRVNVIIPVKKDNDANQ
ncbi:MAG: lipopolysaccharide transport periplasmic protein LptA [Pseudomonadales bacterium]|nr:lipopolysaccharide transport periplasmic protein LptA [Pseudomonadales bacterium]